MTTTSVRSNRLVTTFAVAAVSIAALAAAASAWVGQPGDGSPVGLYVSARPAADEPVRVVKAPATLDVQRQPASCGDCGAAPSTERSL